MLWGAAPCNLRRAERNRRYTLPAHRRMAAPTHEQSLVRLLGSEVTWRQASVAFATDVDSLHRFGPIGPTGQCFRTGFPFSEPPENKPREPPLPCSGPPSPRGEFYLHVAPPRLRLKYLRCFLWECEQLHSRRSQAPVIIRQQSWLLD